MSMLGNYFKHKVNSSGTTTNVPLGLHPGTRVDISDVPIILSQSAGSLFTDDKAFQTLFPRSFTIDSIGYYTQEDFTVLRAYFADEMCFLELPTKSSDPTKPIHIRIFRTFQEDYVTDELKDFLLTGEQPLIGWYQFGIDDNKVVYDRSWVSGTNVPDSVKPVYTKETLIDKTKQEVQHDEHNIMLYQRSLGDVTEFLYADFVTQHKGDKSAEVFRTFIGIEVQLTDLDILPTV
jgi:hypothetical protein